MFQFIIYINYAYDFDHQAIALVYIIINGMFVLNIEFVNIEIGDLKVV